MLLRVQRVGINADADPEFLDLSPSRRDKEEACPRYQHGHKNECFSKDTDLFHLSPPFLI
jgi:hypothetical protein